MAAPNPDEIRRVAERYAGEVYYSPRYSDDEWEYRSVSFFSRDDEATELR